MLSPRSSQSLLALTLAMSLAATACQKKNDKAETETSSTETTEESQSTVTLNFVSAKGAGTALTGAVGETSGGGLKSLKYFITSVSICQEATLNGTGYSNVSGCLDLYSFDRSKFEDDIYDKMDQTEAEKAIYNEYYKDLMQGLSLSGKVGVRDVGVYKYALVNWMKPIKVTATVPLNDGTTLYTHAGKYNSNTDANSVVRHQTLIENMTMGPAEESIVMLDNGGSVFSFFKPFEIALDDVQAGTAYSIDMIFNPEGVIKGASGSVGSSTIFAVDANGSLEGPTISVPFISLIPLVHKTSDAIVKETYAIHFPVGTTGTAITSGATISGLLSPFDIRLELYFLKDTSAVASDGTVTTDLKEKIYGAHTEAAYINNGIVKTLNTPVVPTVFSISQNESTEEYSFYNWQGATGMPAIGNFKRLSNVGDTGTASTFCGDGGIGISDGGCYDNSAAKHYDVKFTPSYELVGRQGVESLVKSTLETIVPYSIAITYDAAISLNKNVCLAFTVSSVKFGSEKTGTDIADITEMAAPADISVSVFTDAQNSDFYTDENCSASSKQFEIKKGAKNATFFFKTSVAGNVKISAQGSASEKNDEIDLVIAN